MALRSVLKLNVTNIASQLCNPRTVKPVTSNLLPVAAQTKATLYLSPELTYTQKRYARRKADYSHLPPLDLSFSGDNEPQRAIDPNTLLFKYRNIPELEQLPPEMKKMFTYAHGSGKDKLEHRNAVLQDKVVKLFGPNASLERQVAYLTVKIQNMKPYIANTRQNKKHKDYLYNRIAMRRKMLNYLRRLDYGRFDWLLRELNVTYTTVPRYQYFRLGRKAQEKKRIREDFFSVKQEKMRSMKKNIIQQKGEFADHKQKVLDSIASEVSNYGITMEEVMKVYEDNLAKKQAALTKKNRDITTNWAKLREAIIKQREQKERDKWVY